MAPWKCGMGDVEAEAEVALVVVGAQEGGDEARLRSLRKLLDSFRK